MSCLCHVWCLPGTAEGDCGEGRGDGRHHQRAPNQKHDPLTGEGQGHGFLYTSMHMLGSTR